MSTEKFQDNQKKRNQKNRDDVLDALNNEKPKTPFSPPPAPPDIKPKIILKWSTRSIFEMTLEEIIEKTKTSSILNQIYDGLTSDGGDTIFGLNGSLKNTPIIIGEQSMPARRMPSTIQEFTITTNAKGPFKLQPEKVRYMDMIPHSYAWVKIGNESKKPIFSTFTQTDKIRLDADKILLTTNGTQSESNTIGYYMCFFLVGRRKFAKISKNMKKIKLTILDESTSNTNNNDFVFALNNTKGILIPCFLLYYIPWKTHIGINLTDKSNLSSPSSYLEYFFKEVINQNVVFDYVNEIPDESTRKDLNFILGKKYTSKFLNWYSMETHNYGNCRVELRTLDANSKVDYTTCGTIVLVTNISKRMNKARKPDFLSFAVIGVIFYYNDQPTKHEESLTLYSMLDYEMLDKTLLEKFQLSIPTMGSELIRDDTTENVTEQSKATYSILDGSFEWYNNNVPSRGRFMRTQPLDRRSIIINPGSTFGLNTFSSASITLYYSLWNIRYLDNGGLFPAEYSRTLSGTYLVDEQCEGEATITTTTNLSTTGTTTLTTNKKLMRLMPINWMVSKNRQITSRVPTCLYKQTLIGIVKLTKQFAPKVTSTIYYSPTNKLINLDQVAYSTLLSFKNRFSLDDWHNYWEKLIIPENIKKAITDTLPSNAQFAPKEILVNMREIYPQRVANFTVLGNDYSVVNLMEILSLVSYMEPAYLISLSAGHMSQSMSEFLQKGQDNVQALFEQDDLIVRLFNAYLERYFAKSRGQFTMLERVKRTMVRAYFYNILRRHNFGSIPKSIPPIVYSNLPDIQGGRPLNIDEKITYEDVLSGNAEMKLTHNPFKTDDSILKEENGGDDSDNPLVVNGSTNYAPILWLEKIYQVEPYEASIFEFWIHNIWTVQQDYYWRVKFEPHSDIILFLSRKTDNIGELFVDIDNVFFGGSFLDKFISRAITLDYQQLWTHSSQLWSHLFYPKFNNSMPVFFDIKKTPNIGSEFSMVMTMTRPKTDILFYQVLNAIFGNPDWIEIAFPSSIPDNRLVDATVKITVDQKMFDTLNGTIYNKYASDKPHHIWTEFGNPFLIDDGGSKMDAWNWLTREVERDGFRSLVSLCIDGALHFSKHHDETIFDTIHYQLRAIKQSLSNCSLDSQEIMYINMQIRDTISFIPLDIEFKIINLLGHHFKLDILNKKIKDGDSIKRESLLLLYPKEYAIDRVEKRFHYYIEFVVSKLYTSGNSFELSLDILIRFLWQLCLLDYLHILSPNILDDELATFITNPCSLGYKYYSPLKHLKWIWHGTMKKTLPLSMRHLIGLNTSDSPYNAICMDGPIDYYTLKVKAITSTDPYDPDSIKCHGVTVPRETTILIYFLRLLYNQHLIQWFDVYASNRIKHGYCTFDIFIKKDHYNYQKIPSNECGWPAQLSKTGRYMWFKDLKSSSMDALRQDVKLNILFSLGSISTVGVQEFYTMLSKRGKDTTLLEPYSSMAIAKPKDELPYYTLAQPPRTNTTPQFRLVDYPILTGDNRMVMNNIQHDIFYECGHGVSELQRVLSGAVLKESEVRKWMPIRECKAPYSSIIPGTTPIKDRLSFKDALKEYLPSFLESLHSFLKVNLPIKYKRQQTLIWFFLQQILIEKNHSFSIPISNDDVLRRAQDLIEKYKLNQDVDSLPVLRELFLDLAKKYNDIVEWIKSITRQFFLDMFNISKECVIVVKNYPKLN